MQATRISPDRIEDATRIVDPVFLNSPQFRCDTLGRTLGAEVVLKVETLNPIRSFKGRGSDFFVKSQAENTPLVVASAGNFGQGVAYSAGKKGIAVVVFAPEQANPLKVGRMRDLGATVYLKGGDFDESKAIAREFARDRAYRFVEDGLDPEISEGAGTIAVELLRHEPSVDAVVVPVGNGALINGVGAWIKSRAPSTRVVGVCAANAPSMEMSWRKRAPVSTEGARTIADGLAVRVPVPAAVEDMAQFVDEILLVDEQEITEAMRLVMRSTGMLVEPSAAVGVAAIAVNRSRFEGQLVATILCGSNVTEEQVVRWFFPAWRAGAPCHAEG